MNNNFWQLLGIDKTIDITEIRNAYRAKLPQYHPETDPVGFKALREAYELAMQYAKSPEETDEQSNQEQEEVSITEEERQVKEICDNYQALLDDPARCNDVDEWQKFIASFFDYPMSVLDIAKWKMLDISYDTLTISLTCVKILAENLRWRQQVKDHYPDKIEMYENFFDHIERGDFFDYNCLPKNNKAVQNETINYVRNAQWIFWDKPYKELNKYFSIHTVIYLPNNQELMEDLANWHSFAKVKNKSLLEYALTRIANSNQDEANQWKVVAAIQYSLLGDKENAFQFWVELYHLPQYQEQATIWLIEWCTKNHQNYLPLLLLALNQSYCLPAETDNKYLYAIPQLTTSTNSRLFKLKIEDYPEEIANVIRWATDINWNYRQVLYTLLHDDGTSSFYRLYRHAIMLRHGNETLLHAILNDHFEDQFEQFILQNLQRQAKQHLEWLTKLSPVQEFKTWLYHDDTIIPTKFDPDEKGEYVLFGRLWLDRFDDIPDTAKLNLYRNISYRNMEMFDWPIYFHFRGRDNLPKLPAELITDNKDAYWQWYRHCLLVVTIGNSPFKAANFIRKNNQLFHLSDDDQLTPLLNTFKSNEWQNEAELYNLIDCNNKLTSSMLCNYPNAIEYFIDIPEDVNFTDIKQNIDQLWQAKLANHSPAYLMLLHTIILNKLNQKGELHLILQKLAGDDKALQQLAKAFENKLSISSSFRKKNRDIYESLKQLKSLNENLSEDNMIFNDDKINKLENIKGDTDNDLILRLCSTLLLAKNIENQKNLEAKSLPKNKSHQIWRWNGRTNGKGFYNQICCVTTILSFLIIKLSGVKSSHHMIYYILFALIIINIIFAIRRRSNDAYSCGKYRLSIFSPSINQTNRYGPPLDS